MHIIFGKEQAEQFQDKYTVLELDTVKLRPDDMTVIAYCVLEQIPITEMAQVESHKDLHKNLMINYKKQDWNFCFQALEHLMGKWNSEMDSFYFDLSSRIHKFQQEPPEPGWDGTVVKEVASV